LTAQVHKTIRLHRIQAAFRRSSARYRAFVGGRGSGKTWAGGYDLLRRARPGRTYLVASPTGVLMQDTTLPTVEAIARDLGLWNPANVRRSPYPTVRLTSGATIRFRTAEDPEKLRGPNLSGVWLDEASLMGRGAYDISIACLREGGEQGWLSATMTPKGLAHWTFEVFGRGAPDTELFHASTRDNPFNPPGFYADLARQYSGDFAAQELEGRFVDEDAAMKVIPAAWVEAAMARWRPGPPAGARLSAVGVDVARGGRAQTVLAKRYANWWAQLEKHPGKSTPDGQAVAALIAKALQENSSALVCIDALGVGTAPVDVIRMAVKGVRLLPILSGNSINATDRAGVLRFVNVRAFLYWSFRELLDPSNGHNVQLPPDRELLADLTAPRWELTASGVKVEAKEKIVERLGRSVDAGDAVVYSIALPT
jgi:hypothetical protein